MIKGVIILVVVVINVVLQRIADKNALKGRAFAIVARIMAARQEN